ncbi:MAG: outer membrane beta-barrel protein [Planctomycetes bacterium]|nr:outer membrane beta-barrel protein [Planctomycetota bacterium]
MLCALAAGLLALASAFGARAETIPEINIAGEEVVAGGTDLRWRQWEFHPYLAVDGEYTDNLFYANRKRVDDFRLDVVPGVNINCPFGRNHSFKLDWQSKIFFYADQDNFNGHEQLGDAQLKLDYERYFFEFRDRYAYLQQVGDIEITDQLIRWANDASITAGARFERIDFSFGYIKEMRRWPKDENHDLDNTKDIGTATINYKLTHSISLFGRGEYRRLDYDGDLDGNLVRRTDQNQQILLVGAQGSWGPSVGWSAAVGSEHLRLRKRSRSLRPEEAETASDHLLARASLKWDARPERTSVQFEFGKGVRESTLADYSDDTSVTVAVEHRWMDRLKTRLALSHGFYNRAKGPDAKTYSVNLRTVYHFKRGTSFFLRWNYDNRDDIDSDTDTDYYRNTVTLGGILLW